MRGFVVVAIVLCAFACSRYEPYTCATDEQCAREGVQGTCEESGYCTFPDTECSGGRRYEPYAGAGLAGACIEKCGAVGEACCDAEVACGGNGYCESGTCDACITKLALGRRFMCALKYDGTVWCSGSNSEGQLGNGIVSDTLVSTPVQVLVAAGSPLDNVTSITAGYDFACATRVDGSVWCWGSNNAGKLGNGAVLMPTPPPSGFAVQVITTANTPLTGAADVAAGDNSACARLFSGGVQCWGENGSGQLGDGTTVDRSKSAITLGVAGIAELAMGDNHACGRTGANNIFCWGDGGSGQLFDNGTADRSTPVMVANSSSFGTGRFYTCIVGPDSTISCAGWNGHGRFGIGLGESYEDGDYVTPVQTLASINGPPFTGVAEIGTGGVTCARMIDKTVYCWGDNTYGATGTGTGSTLPLQVVYRDGTPLTGAEKLFVHWQRACVVLTSGEIQCWGRNLQGEMGDGTFTNRGFPQPYSIGCP